MRRWIPAIVFGLILGLSFPVVAHTPTAPVIGATMQVFEYPDFDTELTACDGTELFPGPQARVHVNVWTEAAPSEHWATEFKFFKQTFRNGRPTWSPQWMSEWEHQNLSPAMFGAVTEMRFNVWDLEPGNVYRFEMKIVGDESGNTFWRICSFKT